MIRVVIDTNVLISAVLHPLGLPAQVFLVVIAGSTARLCVSGEVFAEDDEVIRRPRFQRSERLIAETLRAIRETAIWVRPSQKASGCTDPDDNIFLECVQASQAQYLVTGNTRHFPSRWHNTFVVTPR